MKRPMLVSGIATILGGAVLVSFGNTAAVVLLAVAVSVLILYFIKPLKLRDKIVIPAICISLILASISFFVYNSVKVEPFLKYNGITADVSGKVTDVPIVKYNNIIFTIKADKIGNDDANTKISVQIPLGDSELPEPFDYIFLENCTLAVDYGDTGEISASGLSDGTPLEAQANSFDTLWQCTKTPYYYCLKLKSTLTNQIHSFLNTEQAGFLCGMLFGDTSKIPSSVLSDFRASGIAHLLAVSGLHTSLWCGLLLALTKLLKLNEKVGNIICIVFLCGFCIISAFTPSVMRASLMMGVTLLAPFFKRRSDALNSLGFAVTILLLINPYTLLSIGFQLSASSTLGVLMSSKINMKISEKTVKIKNPILHKSTSFLLENIAVSSFAGLFTLPLSALYFGVFCIIAPITNILCVQIAFWGMLAGIFSTAVSFIPITAVKTVAIYMFKATSILLKLVTDMSSFIADFKFASIPIREATLICVIVCTALFGSLAYFIHKRKSKKGYIIKLSAVCLAVNVVLISIPCTATAEITIHNVGDGVNVSMRSGLKYAFFNCGCENSPLDKTKLPRATCETLDYLYISSSTTKANYVSKTLTEYSPKKTVITNYAKSYLTESDFQFPENTIIGNFNKFDFDKSINIESVDTYGINCVIISSKNKVVMISYGNNDINASFDSFGTPDILIISEDIPPELPENVDTLVISAGDDIILNENTLALKKQCDKYYTTAENGTITLTL